MDTVKLMAVGDIFLKTRNNRSPFGKVRNILQDKDILFGNLETVLSLEGKKKQKAVSLSISPEKVKYLKKANFDILNLTNNHIMDLGITGFTETLELLKKHGLKTIGVRTKPKKKYTIIEKKGIKLGFLGYSGSGFISAKKNTWINKIELKTIMKDIEAIKQKCDFVIISLHWGIENVFYPSPQQIEFAHKLIEGGATIILGHHPHVIQGIEKYKNGLIVYSLGNFQFDPSVSNSPNNQSFILTIKLAKNGLEGYNITPVKIDSDFVPVPAVEEREEIRQFIFKISRNINDGIITWRWWFEQIASKYLSGNMKAFIIRIRKFGFRHFLQLIRWLISPFVVKCYIGFLSKKIKGH